MDKTSVIFGNEIDRKTIRKAYKQQKKFLKKFGDDRNTRWHLAAVDNEVLTPAMGVKVLVLSDNPMETLPEKPLIIGNIRMGFGHYRISMAMASCARHLGYTPLWFDLNSFKETTCTKIISYQNDLYSMGSRLSQKISLFNKLYWEPLNSEGFRQLTYNAVDQAAAELMVPVFNDLPKDTPYIATHVWPSQAAVHAGMTKVVNAIPDNWPMALHLSEGALHTVQTPSSYLGYRLLRGFAKDKVLHPMGENDILYTGQYIDHELVSNIEADCAARIARCKEGRPVRFLLTVGGAGAQGEFFAGIVKTILPYVQQNRASLYINVGDYKNVWDTMQKNIPELKDLVASGLCKTHFDNWADTKAFAEKELTAKDTTGKIDVFCHKDIFAAVYTTNLLMRACDVLVTKPSELAFYPVPKLHIRRVGGHEAWGAIRSAENGDGTYELSTVAEASNMARNMIENPDIIPGMCAHIIECKQRGIYDGAYKVVEAAANR
ncbi:MAG: hypothetical protein MJ178_05810 [Treponemataceae bacterium]|nr:hypothetical protein [Treponemataceae bacterium]